MGWMKAIATDAEELRDTVLASSPEALADNVRGAGWISPTEAFLVTGVINEVLEAGTLNETDAGKLRRVLSIIGAQTWH
jgi:hypothetical protein